MKPRPAKDYRGMILCDPCWDGRHYNKVKGFAKVCLCEGGLCQCPCSELMRPVRKAKRDKSLQRDIPSEFGSIEVK